LYKDNSKIIKLLEDVNIHYLTFFSTTAASCSHSETQAIDMKIISEFSSSKYYLRMSSCPIYD